MPKACKVHLLQQAVLFTGHSLASATLVIDDWCRIQGAEQVANGEVRCGNGCREAMLSDDQHDIVTEYTVQVMGPHLAHENKTQWVCTGYQVLQDGLVGYVHGIHRICENSRRGVSLMTDAAFRSLDPGRCHPQALSTAAVSTWCGGRMASSTVGRVMTSKVCTDCACLP